MIALDHINIHAFDQEAVRDFLVAVLGLEEGFRPPFTFAGYWLYLDGKPLIHLQGRDPADTGKGWVDHIAFAPFDFDRQKQRLDAAGLAYTATGIPGTGIRQLFVAGPGGLRLELQCPQ